jgi:hypothetical protein
MRGEKRIKEKVPSYTQRTLVCKTGLKVPNPKFHAPRKSAQGGFLGTLDLGLGAWDF